VTHGQCEARPTGLHGITTLWPVPNHTAWWQRHTREQLAQTYNNSNTLTITPPSHMVANYAQRYEILKHSVTPACYDTTLSMLCHWYKSIQLMCYTHGVQVVSFPPNSTNIEQPVLITHVKGIKMTVAFCRTLAVAHCGPIPMTCGNCLCQEHITNSVIGVSRPPVLDYGTTFHLDSGGRD